MGAPTSQPIVDFMIVGAQKAGTSALATFLNEHPAIEMSFQKECHIFDNPEVHSESVDQINSRYRTFFTSEAASGLRRGEATPIYMFFAECLSPIKAYNPDIKLIVLLRNPVERAFSQYRMEYLRGKETRGFLTALLLEPWRLMSSKSQKFAENSEWRTHSYLRRGFYASQIENLYNLFGKDSVIVIDQRSLELNHDDTLQCFFEFLGVGVEACIDSSSVFSHAEELSEPRYLGILKRLFRVLFFSELNRMKKLVTNQVFESVYSGH